ncbi:unnamed protein product [Ilex paraguariensis]|uniref:Uncharacterized protein n=1 Tax=Ilex paraguariensis TaxID=185542 RepID=A0ABC8U082_9AQUA
MALSSSMRFFSSASFGLIFPFSSDNHQLLIFEYWRHQDRQNQKEGFLYSLFFFPLRLPSSLVAQQQGDSSLAPGQSLGQGGPSLVPGQGGPNGSVISSGTITSVGGCSEAQGPLTLPHEPWIITQLGQVH